MDVAGGTLRAVVEARARTAPLAPVIAAPGRDPLDANALAALVGGLGVLLDERGVGTRGRIALVTHNGPEAAARSSRSPPTARALR